MDSKQYIYITYYRDDIYMSTTSEITIIEKKPHLDHFVRFSVMHIVLIAVNNTVYRTFVERHDVLKMKIQFIIFVNI